MVVRASFGEVGLSPGQFSYPRAIDAIETEGGTELFVCDKTARVQRMTPEGTPIGVVRMPERELGKPTGITIAAHPLDPARRALWVADTHYHRVLVYDLPESEAFAPEQLDPPPSEPVLSFGSYGDAVGEFIYPTDVAVLADASGAIERVYVSEYGGNDRITVFVPEGAGAEMTFVPSFVIGSFGNTEEAAGPDDVVFNRPQGLAIDARARGGAGELVVADSCNHRLARLTLDGELIAWVGGLGDEPGSFKYPYSVALLADSTALVCEFGGCRVQQVDLETGASLATFGGPGFGEGTLAKPWGVAVVGGTAWVLDSGRNRVVGFDAPARGLEVARGG